MVLAPSTLEIQPLWHSKGNKYGKGDKNKGKGNNDPKPSPVQASSSNCPQLATHLVNFRLGMKSQSKPLLEAYIYLKSNGHESEHFQPATGDYMIQHRAKIARDENDAKKIIQI